MPVWIKDALLDVISLLIIIVYTLTLNNIIEIVLWVYTSLLLLSKILYLFTPFLRNKAKKTSVPEIFYHFIYLFSIVALFISENFYLLAAWAIIWLLSALPNWIKKKPVSTT